jgi:succinate dehydrogenase / fumarate reductase cytochrome b subunit
MVQGVSEKPAISPRARPAMPARRFWPTNPIAALWSTAVGKKVVMGVTGVVLVGFVIAHMVGNLKIFLGVEAIDSYASFLRTMGEPLVPYETMLWTARLILLLSVVLHIVAAIQLTLMNRAARPRSYETKRSLATSYGALTMRWSGVLLAVFVVYHILHLTAGAVGFQPGQYEHLKVYKNVVAAFSVWYVTAFYVLAMAGLCFHLDHGIWSMFQTLGVNNARISPGLRILSRIVAVVVFAGFVAVPVAVLAGWLSQQE